MSMSSCLLSISSIFLSRVSKSETYSFFTITLVEASVGSYWQSKPRFWQREHFGRSPLHRDLRVRPIDSQCYSLSSLERAYRQALQASATLRLFDGGPLAPSEALSSPPVAPFKFIFPLKYVYPRLVASVHGILGDELEGRRRS